MTETTDKPTRKGVPLWAQILIWVVLIGLLVIVGITLNKRQQGSIQPGATISDFKLTLFKGYEYEGRTEVKLSDLKGKVVLLNFWASWCKTCEQEASELEEAWKAYEPTGKVVFLGVDWVDTEPEARVFMQKYGVTYPNGPDLGTRISQLFRVTGAPETYFIDKTGVLRYVQIGPFLSVADIQKQIDALLAE